VHDALAFQSLQGSHLAFQTSNLVYKIDLNAEKWIKCDSMIHQYPLIPCEECHNTGKMISRAWYDKQRAFVQSLVIENEETM
jgi:hypothetical protein